MSRSLYSFCGTTLSTALIATALLSSSAYAQQNTSADNSAKQAATPGWWQQTKDSVGDRFNNITDNGAMELYVPGYSYHGRNTYTPEKLHELNEEAWGIGGGRTIRNANGNDESLFFMAFSDSHFKPQVQAGYIHEWVFQVPKSPIEVSGGYTAMLVSRADYLSHFPFPLALPVAGIGTKKAKLMFTYVPRLSKNKGNGDVLFIFTRFEVD